MAGKRYVTGGFTPDGFGRGQRRRQAKATRVLSAAAAKSEREQKAAQHEELEQERKTGNQLPRNGAKGAEAGRSHKAFKVPAHLGTSDVVGGAYPFLAEKGLGHQGVFIGEDVWSGGGFCFDPWVLYNQVPRVLSNPNILLAGVIGQGKTALAICMATRGIAFGRKVYVPGDPKGEWSAVSRAVGGQVIDLGDGSYTILNPLDEGPRPGGITDTEWGSRVASRRLSLLVSLTESALTRALQPREHTAINQALRTAVGQLGVPTLTKVVNALFEPTWAVLGATVEQLAADGNDLGHALRRLVDGDLAGLFDGESTVQFDPTLPMVSVDLSRIQGNDQLLAMVMTCVGAWMEAALADPKAGLRWVIYDEAWRLIKHPALLNRMEAQWKLSRALGIANLIIIHRLSDLDAVGDQNSGARNQALGLLRDCGTKIIYQQDSSEAPHTAAVLGLSSTEEAEILKLSSGDGLWRIGLRSFVVRHLRTANEELLTDSDARMAEKATA